MKKYIFTAAALITCFYTSGCFYYPIQNQQSFSHEDPLPDDTADMPVSQKMPSDLKFLEKGDTLKNDIVNITVNSAGLYETFEAEEPGDKDWRYLVVNITAESRFKESAILFVPASDFLLTWDDLDGYAVTPEKSTYINDQLPDYNNKIRLFKNSSRTGNLIFIVPRDADKLYLIYSNSAVPFKASKEEDPYNHYSDYYLDGDPYYKTPYYDSYDSDWFDDFFEYFDDDFDSDFDDHSSEDFPKDAKTANIF
ncbi:DUF4352 domain-containing protein [Lachnospiraceae bacterium 62-35]